MAFQYHICIVPQDSLVCPAVSRSSLFAPVVLTLRLLSSYSTAWKCLDVIWRPSCSTGWFLLMSVLWSSRSQVASEIQFVLDRALRGGLLTLCQRYLKLAYSLRIGPLFGATTGQEALPLRYLILRLYPQPLRSSRIRLWYVETCVSLMQRL